MSRERIGLVLGSGAARGWAHIGVLRALADRGIEPDVVCGSSIGALVAAGYCSGTLDGLEAWVRSLDWWDIVRALDPTVGGGGFIGGENLMEMLNHHLGHDTIESLPRRFGAVATNLRTGEEVWLDHGPLLSAVRASIALPGLFTPVVIEEQLLVDGGLVNPVPISLCRALGADRIIAVNLNGDIVGRHLHGDDAITDPRRPQAEAPWYQFLERLRSGVGEAGFGRLLTRHPTAQPGLFDVLASAINIMQDRITRSRLADDPPDVLITPRLAHLGLLEFDRAEDAISEGYASVDRALPGLGAVIGG